MIKSLSYLELAINKKQLDSFIKILYATVSVLATDTANKDLAVLVNSWAPQSKLIEDLLGVSISADLAKVVKTGTVDEDALLPVAKDLRKAITNVLKADTSVAHTELEMLQALSTYMVSRSDTALSKSMKLLPSLNTKELTDAFIFKAKSQKDFTKPLQKIVQAATKERGKSILTAEQGKALKESHPEVYKEYLRLRKEYNQVWKDELRNLVFESKKQALNFDTVVKALTAKGLEFNLPVGFKGLIDANGKLYTVKGKGIAGLPGVGFSIQMNPDYDPVADDSYVFTTVNDTTGERSQHVYTEDYKKKATEEKFEKVKDLDKVLDGVRKKWLTHVKKLDKTPQAVASTVLELLYAFSARVGSMGNEARGESTYGMVTLLAKHFKIDGNKITITYLGKDGVKQIHKLDGSSTESKLLVRNLKLYLADKEPKDRVFTYELGSRELPLTGNALNQWFKKLGSPVTVHKLRHVRGTRLFNELIAANEDKLFNAKKPLNDAQAMAMFKQLATKVGQMLGHVRGIGQQQQVTPMTAIQNYIDTGVMKDYFTRLGLRLPKFLEKVKT